MSLIRPDLSLKQFANGLLDGSIEVEPANIDPRTAPAETYRTPNVKISPDIAAILDSLIDLNEPLPDDTLQAAIEAGTHLHGQTVRTQELEEIAAINRNRVFEKRDAVRAGERIDDPALAKAKLRELAIHQKFIVPDVLARNMAALCSYYNNKPSDKRFKTERIDGPASPLLIWRTR
jgi:hypothetical protein